jgi:hypothetical protein
VVRHSLFNAGNDLDLPGAALTGFNIDPDAAQLKTRLSRPLKAYFWCIHVIAAWRSTGVLSSQCSSLG